MIEHIKKDLKTIYKDKEARLKHVLGVEKMALKLAKEHHVDSEKIQIAALLHDITKYMPTKEHIQIIKDHYKNSEEILNGYNKFIYHGFTAAVVARNKYHIKDQDILNAIIHHTVGKPAMTIYEKIIFIADYTEENRTYPNCIKARNLLSQNIDLAVYEAINDSITLYESKNDQIPKIAYEARTYYKEIKENQHGKN
jgi:predicted HD superfamily hydrolase involved in NAD metabolism